MDRDAELRRQSREDIKHKDKHNHKPQRLSMDTIRSRQQRRRWRYWMKGYVT